MMLEITITLNLLMLYILSTYTHCKVVDLKCRTYLLEKTLEENGIYL